MYFLLKTYWDLHPEIEIPSFDPIKGDDGDEITLQNEYRDLRAAPNAGRTQVFTHLHLDKEKGLLHIKGDMEMVDVVSLYPYSMLEKWFPAGKLTLGTYDDFLKANAQREKEDRLPLFGFFNARFRQQNLQVKILPRRVKGEPLDWNYGDWIEQKMVNTVDLQ